MDEFKVYMQRVFEVQFEGRRQRDHALQTADLQRLTREKGGYSVMMFRRLLPDPLSLAEKRAVLEFGYLMQLADDIFDLWHDRQDGIRTLATTANSAIDMQDLFENQVVAVRAAFRKTIFPKRQVETSLYIVLGIVSVTRVCLRQYLFWENKLGSMPFDDREKMVCDMEKWGNMARAGWGCIRENEY